MEWPQLPHLHHHVVRAADHEKQPDQSSSSIDSPISFENRIEIEPTTHSSQQHLSGKYLIWGAIQTCIPMMMLSAALLAVVLAYEVKPRNNVFEVASIVEDYRKASYWLVQFSSTKIVFLASFLSTLAPLLSGCVMTMASVSLLRRFHQECRRTSSMPASVRDQDLLLTGLTAASYLKLFSSLKYIMSRRNSGKSRAVCYAAALLLVTVLMGIAVAVADAVLHMVTESVNYTLYLEPGLPTVENGRGLVDWCANFDRSRNVGFPCNWLVIPGLVNPNYFAEVAEGERIFRNTSDKSELRFAPLTGKDGAGVSFVVSKSTTIDSHLGFRAGTLGASAKCSIIPPSTCNITRWGPGAKLYTSFNCSSNFWGTLGLAENATSSSSNSLRQPSPYLPLLGMKPQPNLQFGYYVDETLQTVYNPAGRNDSYRADPNLKPIATDQLPSSIHAAYAWRINYSGFAGGQKNEMYLTNQTSPNPDPATGYQEYFLRCEISTYDVGYTWVNSSISSISPTKINNGSLLQMWQVTSPYGYTTTGGGLALQDINTQAASYSNKTQGYLDKYSELLSHHIMGVIGGHTSPRTVQQQQSRQELLLAKVPKVALGVLLGTSLLYPVLGIFLLFMAHRSMRKHWMDHPTNLTRRPTYPAIVAAEWHPHDIKTPVPAIRTTNVRTPHNNRSQAPATNRNSTAGLRFALWGNAGIGPNFNHLQPETDHDHHMMRHQQH